MNWKAVVASVKGTAHERCGLPCQDHGAVKRLANGVAVGAVADGAGSARHADVAAQFASKIVVAYLENRDWSSGPMEQFSVREIFSQLVNTLVSLLKGVAAVRLSSSRDWACTLIVIVTSPHGMAALQIGDGFLVVRWPDQEDYTLLFEPDHGEYVNQTSFIIDADVSNRMKIGCWKQAPTFLCASTDGLERLAINTRTWKPHSPFFQPFEEHLKTNIEEDRIRRDLVDFLDSKDVNRRVDDDKTLLMMTCQHR